MLPRAAIPLGKEYQSSEHIPPRDWVDERQDQASDLEWAIDWEIMKDRYWNDTDEDGDRKRRRQAEFLVHQAVPWSLVRAVCVIDANISAQVKQILQQHSQNTAVALGLKSKFCPRDEKKQNVFCKSRNLSEVNI